MNTKFSMYALAAASLTAACQCAVASTITLNYAGSADFGSGGVGYFNGSVAPNPNSSASLVAVGIGGDSLTSANHAYDFSATGQFNAWCVDIYHWMGSGSIIYNVGTGGDLAAALSAVHPGTGLTRVSQLGHLASEVYSTVNTATESAAFQLAVWAVTYGTADNTGHYHINTTDAGFHVDSGTMGSAYGVLANSWLTNLGSAANTGNYSLTYLNDGTGNYTQDLVVFTAVPEPGTYVLLAAGLFGLGWQRKKPAKKLA